MALKFVEPRDFVASWDELADQIGISRRTIARMMKVDGHPEKVNGMYDVDEWRKFREQFVSDSISMDSVPLEMKKRLAMARIRRETAIAEREELALLKMKGELVDVATCKAEFTNFYQRLTYRLREMLRSIKQLDVADADNLWHDFLRDVYDEQMSISKAEKANGVDTPDVVRSLGTKNISEYGVPPDDSIYYDGDDVVTGMASKEIEQPIVDTVIIEQNRPNFAL